MQRRSEASIGGAPSEPQARARTAWRVVFTKQAQKDAKKLASAGLRPRAERLLELLAEDPFQNPPPFEKLVGDLAGFYSRRINIQHRLVYQVRAEEKVVKVICHASPS